MVLVLCKALMKFTILSIFRYNKNMNKALNPIHILSIVLALVKAVITLIKIVIFNKKCRSFYEKIKHNNSNLSWFEKTPVKTIFLGPDQKRVLCEKACLKTWASYQSSIIFRNRQFLNTSSPIPRRNRITDEAWTER